MLSPSPLPAGYDAMGVWTGEVAIILITPRGKEPEGEPGRAQAASYDPATDSWGEIAQPPMASWVSPPAVLLNGELILLSTYGTVDGGETNSFDHPYDTGGIYNIAGDEWRSHSYPSMRENQYWPQTAIDDEVIIDGLAYSPSDDTWRELPDFPIRDRSSPNLVWTGEEFIVWGGIAEGRGDPPPALNDGAAYIPPD